VTEASLFELGEKEVSPFLKGLVKDATSSEGGKQICPFGKTD
jgi:hypothetical protein